MYVVHVCHFCGDLTHKSLDENSKTKQTLDTESRLKWNVIPEDDHVNYENDDI